LLNDASGPNPFEWKSISGDDVFGDKRIALLLVHSRRRFRKPISPATNAITRISSSLEKSLVHWKDRTIK